MSVTLVDPEPMHEPLVVPRAQSPESGSALPLVELITDLCDPDAAGTVAIVGPPGSGKTTAARHLHQSLEGVHVEDDATSLPEGPGWRFYTAARPLEGPHTGVLVLALWGRDEWIEYLLARHPDAVTSVMSRIDDPQFVGGNAELWVAVLDGLARDPTLRSVRAALRAAAPGLKRHSQVRRLLHADKVIASLREGELPSVLLQATGRIVIEEVARRVDGACLDTLNQEVPREVEPAVAGVLARADPEWRPRPLAFLRHAHLGDVVWPGVDLRGADLREADLEHANLSGAELTDSDVSAAHLDGACLDRARLNGLRGQDASLADASLRAASAMRARLERADLRRARLDSSYLCHADLREAILDEAGLPGADLTGARLIGASIEAADFKDANLTLAHLRRLKLAAADFRGACFISANLEQCGLEGMNLDGASFDAATLRGAAITGTSMRRADLRKADLRFALAGYVDWEGADLREADLRGVNFHMGSSRSGLLDSPIASEGSRTGFYTDEYEERGFKAPEEIRKANLCGADLRGALVEDTDFYLVDLRRARYSSRQAHLFKRCGAIL